MLKQIKNKVCELVCKFLGIVPCMCNHECDCKKEAKK